MILMSVTIVGAVLIAMAIALMNQEGLTMNQEEAVCFGASVRVAGKI